MTSDGAHPETRRMMETAIRRLNVLEYVILGVAMALALLAGALAAWMVENLTGAPFRLTWALSSLLFFVVPGWVVFRRERQADGSRVGSTDTAGEAGAIRATEDITELEDVTELVDVTRLEDVPELEDVTEVRDDGGR